MIDLCNSSRAQTELFCPSKGKQHEKMLDGQTKWLKVGQVTVALKESRDKDVMKGHERLH